MMKESDILNKVIIKFKQYTGLKLSMVEQADQPVNDAIM